MLRPVQLVKGQKNVLGPFEFQLDENALAVLKAIAPHMGYRYQEDATYLLLWPEERVTVVPEPKKPNLAYTIS